MGKALGENAQREVGTLLHPHTGESLDDAKKRCKELFSANMKEAFDGWVDAFCKTSQDVDRLTSLIQQFVQRYSEKFAFSFYIYGVRWTKMSLHQFELVLGTIDTVAGVNPDFEESGMRSVAQPSDPVAEHGGADNKEDEEFLDGLLAAQRGAVMADRLISVYLNFGELKLQPERATFVRDVLLRYGKQRAMEICFLLERDDFSRAYLDEVLSLGVHIEPLGEAFLNACERWSLTPQEARRLRVQVLHLYKNQEGRRRRKKTSSYDVVRDTLLEMSEKPLFLGRSVDSVH